MQWANASTTRRLLRSPTRVSNCSAKSANVHVVPRHYGSNRSGTSVAHSFEGNGANSVDGPDVNPKVVSKTLLDIQKNMLAINTSRVKMAGALQAATEALAAREEQLGAKEVALAAAQRRIQELELENDRLRAEKAALATSLQSNGTATAAFALPPQTNGNISSPQQPRSKWQQLSDDQVQVPTSSPSFSPQQQQQPNAVNYTPYPPQQQQRQQPPQQQQQAAMHQPQQQAVAIAPQQQQAGPPAPPPPPPKPAPPAVINITYFTGWHDSFIHYTVDGKAWTSVPGMKMKNNKDNHNEKSVSIDGSKMEFVFTDGHNNWDSPGQYTDKPKNYHITSPGTYRIKSGKLERVSD